MSWATAAIMGGSALASIFSSGKQTQTQNSSGTSSSTGSTTSNGTMNGNSSGNTSGTMNGTNMPVIDPRWLEQFLAAGGAMGPGGMSGDQAAVSAFLRGNIGPNGGATIAPNFDRANQAVGSGLNNIGAGGNTVGGSIDYLKNQQNNGSYTLGAYFGDKTPSSADGTGAGYMGAYQTPLNDDYVNASLADYDAGTDRGFNALRAGNASAFGNKRTGVAEGQFMADAARGRGALGSGLRLNAFNTAAGLGQTDASRAVGNNQFNASLTDSRQKTDIAAAEAGEQRRLGVAGQIAALGGQQAGIGATGASVGSQGLNNALNVNGANLSAAGALSGNSGMSMQQLMQLLNIGGALNGTRTDGTTTGTTSGTTSGTTTGSTTANQSNAFNSTGTGTTPGDPFGQFANLLMAGSYAGDKAGWFK